MNLHLDQFGPPPAALAPAAWIIGRVNLDPVIQAGDADFDAVARAAVAWTGAFERACGRPLVRRVDQALVLDGEDLCNRTWGHLLRLEPLGPAESVASAHYDPAATPIGATFDATTLIDPAAYGLVMRAEERFAVLGFDRTAGVRASGCGNLRVQLTFGYAADDGTPGWTPPAGAAAVPADLAEALADQVAAAVKARRHDDHASASVNVQGQVGTTAYYTERMRRSVRERLLPYCTAEAALNLPRGLDDAQGMA